MARKPFAKKKCPALARKGHHGQKEHAGGWKINLHLPGPQHGSRKRTLNSSQLTRPSPERARSPRRKVPHDGKPPMTCWQHGLNGKKWQLKVMRCISGRSFAKWPCTRARQKHGPSIPFASNVPSRCFSGPAGLWLI